MPTIADIRAQSGDAYNDMSDVQLGDAIHSKFYSDMPRAEFNAKVGLPAPEDVSAGMALRGIPVIGQYIPQAEAAIRAAAQPLTGVGAPGETFSERYAANLPLQQQQYAQAEQDSPIASGALKAGGGTVALMPLGATALGAKALGLTGGVASRLGFGAASGAALSAADEAARGGSLEDIGSAAKFGAGVGAAAPIVAAGVGKAISPFLGSGDPVRAARIATLKAEGYKPTAGEISGSTPLRWAEQHFGELGGAAPEADRLGAAAWRRVGVDANRATPEVVDQAFNTIGQRMDDLAARNTLTADPKLSFDIGRTLKDFQDTGSNNKLVGRYVSEIIDAVHANRNTLPGDVYQGLQSRIETAARKSPWEVAAPLRELKGALDDAMERSMQASGSTDIGAFQQARRDYRNLLVMERVATNPNTQNGVVTPAGLYAATKQVQGVRNMARGRGDMQPLAQAASDVMRGLPSSGTAQRLYYQGIPAVLGTVGGALYSGVDPTSALAAGTAGLLGPPLAGRMLMSRPMQAYLRNQFMARPAGQAIRAGTVGGLLNLPPPQQ